MTLEVRTQILKSLLDASRAIEAERLLLNAKPEGVTAQDRLAHGREAADLDRALGSCGRSLRHHRARVMPMTTYMRVINVATGSVVHRRDGYDLGLPAVPRQGDVVAFVGRAWLVHRVIFVDGSVGSAAIHLHVVELADPEIADLTRG